MAKTYVYTFLQVHTALFHRAASHAHLQFLSVGMRGLEPPWIAPYAPEAYVYTNFTTCPYVGLYSTTALFYSHTLLVYLYACLLTHTKR